MKTRLFLSLMLVLCYVLSGMAKPNIEYNYANKSRLRKADISMKNTLSKTSNILLDISNQVSNKNNWSNSLTYSKEIFSRMKSFFADEKIIYAEYFIDKDPGFGKGTSLPITASSSISNHNFTVSLPATVSEGFHFITIRYKDALGRWSVSVARPFYKDKIDQSTSTLSNIVYVEYFIDKDPGFGKGSSIALTSGTEINNHSFAAVLPTTLEDGFHFITIRYKDALGRWGVSSVRPFYKDKSTQGTALSNIVYAEYFFDKDPGFGKGKSITIKGGQTLENLNFGVNLNALGLSLGKHFIQLRAKDANGIWGTVGTKTFVLTNEIVKMTTLPIVSCTLKKIDIPYIVEGTFGSNNVFTVELSDTSGIFQEFPIQLGSLTSTKSATIRVDLPADLTGNNYKVRIVSTSPVRISDAQSLILKPSFPVVSVSNNVICQTTSAVLTATGCSGTVSWTNNLTGSSVTVTPSKTSNYKAVCTVNGCKSDSSVATTITVTPKPATPVAKSNNSSVCLGTSAVLSATGCSGVVSWTGNLTGSSVIVTPTKTSTYKALCTVNGCKSDSSLATTITVTNKPAQPKITANNATICSGGSSVLTASACTGGILTWTGGLTGASITVSPTATKSYKVLCIVNGCKSDSSLATTITITPKPVQPKITASNATICSSGSSVLTSTACTGGILTWTGGLTGASITVSPTASKAYKVLCSVNGCKSDSSLATTVTVTPKPIQPKVTASNATTCSGGSPVLTSTACIGGILTWTGGLTGASITVSPTASKAYKVLCSVNGCTSDSSLATTITVIPKPNQPKITASNATICSGGSSVLTSTACIGGILTWTGGLTGASITVSPTATKSYKVLCIVNGCKSDSSLATTITVTPKPIQPKVTASNATICSGGSSVLTSTACTGGILTWTGGLTGTSITVSPTETKSYKVLCSISGCKSDSSLATTITVVPKPDAPIITSNTCLNPILNQWNKTIKGNANDWLHTMIPTSDGGYLLGGVSKSGISNDKSEANRGDYDYWLVKVNASGTKVWDKTFGGTKEEVLQSIVPTNDGGFIIAGYSISDIGGDKSEASKGYWDYWLVKINANGIKLWDKTLGGNLTEIQRSIVATNDGGFIVTGFSYSDIGGDKSEKAKGGADYWLVKINANGSKIWDKTFGGNADDNLKSIISTTDGGFLVGGYSNSNQSGDKSEVSKGGWDYWLVKINANGSKVWDKTLGGNSDDVIDPIVATNDGGFLLGGASASDNNGDKSEISKGFFDYWLIKINSAGTKVWDKTLGADKNDFLESIVTTKDGGFLIGGSSFSGKSGDKSEESKGDWDQWIVKINSNGNKIWDKTFGGNKYDELQSIVANNDDEFVLAGYSESDISGDKSEASLNGDFWITKIKQVCDLNNISSTQKPVITASGCTGTVTWSNNDTGNSITVSPTIATTYTATCTVNGCVSQSSNMITVTIPAKPTTPTIIATTSNICSGTSTTLTASVCTNGTLTWTGGLTGSIITVSPLATKSYKVVCTQQGVSSDSSLSTIITVISKPTQPKITVNNATICAGGSSVLTASACTGGTLTWTGGLTGASITVSPTASKAYKVLCNVNACKSDSSLATRITVRPKPAQPKITTSNATICAGGSAVLTSTACTGGTLTWTGGLTGASITISPIKTTAYKVLCTIGGCKSDSSVAVTITVNPKPTIPIAKANNASVCLGTSTVLTATGCIGTVTWTGNLTGSSVTVTPNKTTSYKALCTINGCESDSSTAVTITVNPKPSTPVAKSNNSSVCLGNVAVLSATGCSGVVTWTGNLTGTSVTVTPSKTSTYKALCTIGGCKSDSSTAVKITVLPMAITPVLSATNTSICSGTTTTLSATGCGGIVTWTGGLTGSSVTVLPTKTTSFKALCTIHTCKSDSSVALTITVTAKPLAPIVKISNSTICQDSSTVLTASGCSGIVTWRGGMTGNNITVKPTKTSSYKALCTVNGCSKSDSSLAVSVIVNPKPISPTVNTNSSIICKGAKAILTASACSGVVTWTGGLTGSSVTVSPIKTTTYKAVCVVNGCRSDSSAILTVSVNLPPSVKANNSNICQSSSAVLTATSCNGVVTWTGGLTGSSITVTPTKTSSYKALCTVNGCKSDSSTAVTIIVTPKPSAPVITKQTVTSSNSLIQWDKTIGGNRSDNLSSIISTSDGGYLLGGTSYSDVSGDKAEKNRGDYNTGDYWLVKINANGNKLWDKTFGGDQSDYLSSMINTSDGGYLIVGRSYSGVSGDKTGKGSFWVIKIDTKGNKVWDRTFSENYANATFSTSIVRIVITFDGGYLLGRTINKLVKAGKPEDSDYWLLKIDANGNELWNKTFGGSEYEYLSSIVPTVDGGYVLGGSSGSGVSGDKTQPNKGGDGFWGYEDYWLVKIDANGNKIWDKTFGGDKHDRLSSVISTSDGGYLVGGTSYSDVSGDKTGTSRSNYSGDTDYWLIKINANGNKIWDKSYGRGAIESLSSIISTSDGGYLLGGSSLDDAAGFIQEIKRGYWIIKIDTNGNMIWDKVFGGDYHSAYLSGMVSAFDGGYLLGGISSVGISGDKTQASKGEYDYWIIKIKEEKGTTLTATGCSGTVTWSNGATGSSITVSPTTAITYTATCTVNGCTSSASNAINVSPSVTGNSTSPIEAAKTARVETSQIEPNFGFKVFPNPAKDEISIETDLEGESTFQMYNSIGQKVVEKTFEKKTKISILDFSRGSHFYLIQNQEIRSSGKILLE